MTTTILTAPDTVECQVCHLQVGPTREGGTRPRPHNDKAGDPCEGAKRAELPQCGRCGGAPYKPLRGCRSRTYHPERWTVEVPTADGVRTVEVGNIAAAGEVVGVAGQQYGWLTRLKGADGKPLPESNRRVAPRPIGIRNEDSVPYFDLAAVLEYTKHRPGPGAPGQSRRRSVVVAGAR